MKARRHVSSPAAALLVVLGLASWGCRAREDDPAAGAPETREPARGATDARPDAADAPVMPAAAPRLAARDESPIEEGRLARIDARLLDLQAAINQLELAGADREECELHWEELDARRSALRREEQSAGSEVTASDRDERRRTLAQDLDDLESDLEAAIQEVESRLARG